MSEVVCDVCREVVHAYEGFIVRHGVRVHGELQICLGSGVAVCNVVKDCCG